MAVSMVCGNFTRFTTAKDDPNLGAKFTDWLAKFENELIAWGVDDDRQRKALLLSHAGDGAWEKWLTCTTEEKGDDKAYDSAKKTLSDYFDKKRDPDFEATTETRLRRPLELQRSHNEGIPVEDKEELIQVSNNINRLPTSDHPNTGKLMQRYPELFEDKIGQLKDYEVKLHIDPDVKPVAQPHRRVPFHLRAKVEEEINQLLDADVIEKVEGAPPLGIPPTYLGTRKQLLADIPGALNISDDVIVFGQTQNDHDETLEKTLKKFSDNHLTLNAKKCEFNKTSLEFFGFVFSDSGMKPDPKKVEDIQNLEPPTNVKQLRSVLGMTGYSSRFIPDYATITAPLRELTHKNSSWNWTTTHQEAFETLKEKLQSAPALAYFDISKSTEIAVDASPVGLGAILTQKDENGHSHVIAYGSRSLTKNEQNYSQTEREALALVWGCEHYHLYCYGKALTVFTDHKPLTSIFNNPLSKPTPRIERWSLRFQPYQPNVVYAPGPDNPADYMSRHPKKQIEVHSREEKIAEEYINFVSQHAVPIAIDLEEVKSATLNDHTLQRVIECIRNGSWYKKDAQELRLDNRDFNSYQMVKDELSVNAEGNLVLRVEIVHSTSADAVVPHLDNIISRHQIPIKIRTDNGPPFNSESFAQYTQHMGIKHRKITPLWPEANGECERFMRNLKKICTTARIEHKNWQQEINKFLINYRATPHSSTGVPPYTALYGRPMRTKLPEIPTQSKQDKEMRLNDQQSKDEMKRYADQRRNTRSSNINPNDKVLVHKGKPHQGKTEPYYEPHPYTVIDKKGSMITASDGKNNITRNSSKFKPLKTDVQPINQELMDEQDDIGIEEEPSDDIIEPNASGQGQVHVSPPRNERRYPLRTTRGQMPNMLKDFIVTR
ncbi:hypothetical protein QZH41_012077 [Actinostola sp. cb2023]|nr:hypothetical protein QZH41_012077 [Actinostola sp. cb2023]